MRYRQSVREAPDPVFYEQPLLKPYVFFDVSHGREQRGGTGGGSLRNQVIPDTMLGTHSPHFSRTDRKLPAWHGHACTIASVAFQQQ